MAANTRGTSNRSSEETHGTSSVGVRRGRLVVRMGAKKGAALGQGRLPSGKNTTFAGGGFARLQKFISADLLCEPFPTRASDICLVGHGLHNPWRRPTLLQRSCHVLNAIFDAPARHKCASRLCQ